MKKGLTEMVLILDKSGSMDVAKNDVIGGLNTFIKSQKDLPGEATFTFVQFDHNINTICTNKNIKEIELFNKDDYKPGGNTALLKAVSVTIDEVGKRLSLTKEEDRPEKVIIAIMTDGEENASGSDYSKEKLGEKIRHQTKKYNWEFIFLGANFDVFSAGSSYNISSDHVMAYYNTVDLAKFGMTDYCRSVSLLRTDDTSTN
jgi:uncharacterized protein YegL